MSQMAPDEIALVRQYEGQSLEELYSHIGDLAAQYGDDAATRDYVLGFPNVLDRGAQIVADVRATICGSRSRLEAAFKSRQSQIEPVLWAAQLADVLLAASVTHSVPPLMIAVTLGKLSNRTLAKLCD